MSKYLINYIEEGKMRREYQQKLASVGISLLNSETEQVRGKGGGLWPVSCFLKYHLKKQTTEWTTKRCKVGVEWWGVFACSVFCPEMKNILTLSTHAVGPSPHYKGKMFIFVRGAQEKRNTYRSSDPSIRCSPPAVVQ